MLKPQTEEIFAVEKAGLTAGMSTTKDIFNFRILCEKYLQHHQSLFQVFIVFKKKHSRGIGYNAEVQYQC